MINTTIAELLGQLFIESWSSNLSYTSYFTKCQPAFCSYVVNTQKSALEIVTTITGLIGGLSIVLRLVIPYAVIGSVKLLRNNRHASADVVPQERECFFVSSYQRKLSIVYFRRQS